VGPRDPPPLPPDAHPPGGHAVRPAAGRQSADRAGQAEGEARAGGRRPGAVGKNRRGDVRRVLGADAEEPQGGVRRRHRRRPEAVRQESEAGEEGPQHGRQDEDALHVLVEEVRVRPVGSEENPGTDEETGTADLLVGTGSKNYFFFFHSSGRPQARSPRIPLIQRSSRSTEATRAFRSWRAFCKKIIFVDASKLKDMRL